MDDVVSRGDASWQYRVALAESNRTHGQTATDARGNGWPTPLLVGRGGQHFYVPVGVDGDTGKAVFTGKSGDCTNVEQWTSLIAAKGRIISASNGKLCSWSPH